MAIDLSELQTLLDQASAAAANEKDIRKSLTRVENLISNISKELTCIYGLLDNTGRLKKEHKQRVSKEPVEVDLLAPYGRRKDGTPKSKPGRNKAENAKD